MKSYLTSLEFTQFVRIFKDRYVFEDGGHSLIAMTTTEALLLSKYIFSGIVDWTPPLVNGTGGKSNLGESLERSSLRNTAGTNLIVRATEEEMQALGAFLVRGLVGVFLTLEQAGAELK
ncbi:MAG: hypothetical protein ACREA2_17625 [Blastocatellia bacterium]